MENKVNKRKFIGEVVKDGASKTIAVKIVMKKLHPKYKKHYLASKKYQVHDEKNEAKIGDKVSFIECRPLSKYKRWRLLEVVK